MQKRETFGSRLGFILISAGCAIGLGNVWRFPYITGKYGGAAFILLYLAFLLFFGIPVMTMEFSVGRASRRSISRSFHELEPKGTKWHFWSFFGIAGNIILMMFYTTIAGWMFVYFLKYVNGSFDQMSAQQVTASFDALTADPVTMTIAMAVSVMLGFVVCSFGVKEGVEAVNKKMMALLIVLMAVLAIRAITLDGAQEGLKYFLIPDFSKIVDNGIWNVMYQAMSQAFFTLSVGMGGMAIFGSYIGKEHSLLGESIHVAALDTFVALCSGLIVIPSCFAFGVDPGSGPPLIFITLPSVFEQMPGGRFWGALFFLFMIFAAMSTVIGVMEISFPVLQIYSPICPVRKCLSMAPLHFWFSLCRRYWDSIYGVVCRFWVVIFWTLRIFWYPTIFCRLVRVSMFCSVVSRMAGAGITLWQRRIAEMVISFLLGRVPIVPLSFRLVL